MHYVFFNFSKWGMAISSLFKAYTFENSEFLCLPEVFIYFFHVEKSAVTINLLCAKNSHVLCLLQ